MRKGRFISIILAAALIAVPVCSYAKDTEDYSENPIEEIEEIEDIEEIEENGIEESAEEEVSEEEIRKELVENAGYIDSLTADEDYVAEQAFCSAQSLEEAEKIAEDYDAELISYEGSIAVYNLGRDVSEVIEEEALAQSLNARMHPDYILTEESVNDPSFGTQWFHSKIKDSSVWDETDGKGTIVAVVDTGINKNHSDLKNNILNAVKTGNASSPEDYYSHGTHVCGIIAAEKDNEVGGCGVAPGSELYSICVGNPGNANETITISALLSGMNIAIEDCDADVINISLGLTKNPDSSTISQLQEVMDKAYENGITVVAAAGNQSTSANHYPAALDHVISVGAITQDNKLAYYSNFGKNVDIAAPGSSIYSTVPDDSYGYKSGTSMAAPIVAGAAALIYGADESLRENRNSETVDRVTEILLNSTDGQEYYYGNTGRCVVGCIDFSKLPEQIEKSGSKTEKAADDERQDNADSNGKSEDNSEDNSEDKEDIEDVKNDIKDDNPEESADNSEKLSKTEYINGGELTYKTEINFNGKKLKPSEISMSVSYNGAKYSIKKAKIINGKHAGTATVTIKKLENADKSVNDIFKNISFSVEINPIQVSGNNVGYKLKEDGSLSKVTVNLDGKAKKVRKTMYTYNSSDKKIVFGGDYEGVVEVK